MVKLASCNYPVERLIVSSELAATIFKHNKHKLDQIPLMAEQRPGKYYGRVTVHDSTEKIATTFHMLQINKSYCTELAITSTSVEDLW